MRECERALELISLGLDGALDDGQRRELEGHLDACPACGSLARELERLHAAMPELEEEVPQGFHEAVMERIRAEKKMTPFPRRGKVNVKKWASLAAVLAVILVGAGSLRGYLGGGTDAPAPYAAPATGGGAATAREAPAPYAAAGTGEAGEGGVSSRARDDKTEPVPAPQSRTTANGSLGGRSQDAGSRVPTEEERAALAANCAAWVGEHGLDKVDAGFLSIAPVTQADLEAAVCDEAARERLGMDDWRVTVGDATGTHYVDLICDGGTLEVLGTLPSA